MKRGAMIIDISCDRAGGVETSIPTTIEDPAYKVDGITHYVCDHTPSLFYKTTSESLSEIVAQYCDMLLEGQEDATILKAKIMDNGRILDERINKFQNR
jgi:N5-(carboxyethyl)ornithine synthase